MFEIGFSELLMLGLVSLLVIGPERLPKVARIAGFWVGKLQKTLASVKAEIRHELQVEEMRQLMKERADLDEYQQAINEVHESVADLKSSLQDSPQPTKPNLTKPPPHAAE